MDKQGPQIGITSLAYPEQDLFTPTGVLTWNQSEPGSQLSAILEIVGFTNGRNQRAGGNRANTRDLADTLAESILPIALLNLLVECSDDIEQVRQSTCICRPGSVSKRTTGSACAGRVCLRMNSLRIVSPPR